MSETSLEFRKTNPAKADKIQDIFEISANILRIGHYSGGSFMRDKNDV